MKNYFIIHGFYGSNIENFFPWLKAKIDGPDSLCTIPQFPIEEKYHNYLSWKKILDVYNYDYHMLDEKTTIIAHSTGCAFIIKYLLETKTKIGKLLLVSGFNNYLSPDKDDLHNKLNLTYYVPTGIEQINDYVSKIICFYGDDDPYIPQEELEEFAKTLSAEKVIIPNGGHLNSLSGFNKFTEILKYI